MTTQHSPSGRAGPTNDACAPRNAVSHSHHWQSCILGVADDRPTSSVQRGANDESTNTSLAQCLHGLRLFDLALARRNEKGHGPAGAAPVRPPRRQLGHQRIDQSGMTSPTDIGISFAAARLAPVVAGPRFQIQLPGSSHWCRTKRSLFLEGGRIHHADAPEPRAGRRRMNWWPDRLLEHLLQWPIRGTFHFEERFASPARKAVTGLPRNRALRTGTFQI